MHEPLVCKMKNYLFDNLRAFFIAFDHANTRASMRSLVKIHNSPFYHLSYPTLLKLLICFVFVVVVVEAVERGHHLSGRFLQDQD